MSLPCGCVPKWLTSASEPTTAEEAVTEPCTCCGADPGKRCIGGRSGWLPGILGRKGQPKPEPRAHVEICPARIGQQADPGATARQLYDGLAVEQMQPELARMGVAS